MAVALDKLCKVNRGSGGYKFDVGSVLMVLIFIAVEEVGVFDCKLSLKLAHRLFKATVAPPGLPKLKLVKLELIKSKALMDFEMDDKQDLSCRFRSENHLI